MTPSEDKTPSSAHYGSVEGTCFCPSCPALLIIVKQSNGERWQHTADADGQPGQRHVCRGMHVPPPPVCPTCGRRVWPSIHSCKRIPVCTDHGDYQPCPVCGERALYDALWNPKET